MSVSLTTLQWFILEHLEDGKRENSVAIQQGVESRLQKLNPLSTFEAQLEDLVAQGFVEKSEQIVPKALVTKVDLYSISGRGQRTLERNKPIDAAVINGKSS